MSTFPSKESSVQERPWPKPRRPATPTAPALPRGAGNDTIENQNSGVISGTAKATAEVTGVSVTISTLGFSSSDVTTNADASFTGIAAGAGDDTIHNYGTIDIDAISTATGRSGTGTLLGYGSADASITGTSTSYRYGRR